MLPTGERAFALARLLAVAVPAALLTGAYIGQYGFGLYPCEMCWWQRWPHFAAVALGLLAFAIKGMARPLVALAGVAIAISGLIGGFHAGVEYGWWEGFTTCSAQAGAVGGDPLEAILGAPIIRCDQVQWELLGISLAGFNFLISVPAAALIAVLLRRSKDVAA